MFSLSCDRRPYFDSGTELRHQRGFESLDAILVRIDFLNDRRQRGFAYAQLCCCDIDVQKVDVGVVVTEKNEKYSRKNTDTKNTKLT